MEKYLALLKKEMIRKILLIWIMLIILIEIMEINEKLELPSKTNHIKYFKHHV
jgi:hypothetical protein